MERGDLDPVTLRKRLQIKDQSKAAERHIAELEHENRGLRRRVERAELIGDIQKKRRGSWGWTPRAARTTTKLIEVARVLCEEYPTRLFCVALGVSRATLLRRRKAGADAAVIAPRIAVRRLTQAERDETLALLHSDRFADRSPGQVVAVLLDEGRYVCSESTMYRLLREHGELRERRRQRRHPEYRKPELLATGPNQCWSWDITKLRGPNRGEWYALLVMLDIFSRMVVGWMLVRRANAAIAEAFMEQTIADHEIEPGSLTIHADRGVEMTAHA